MNFQEVMEKVKTIPSWTDVKEREHLFNLASQVHNGRIVEVGALYGGITAILALASPASEIDSIDNFSWTPEGFPKASVQEMTKNMHSAGIHNVFITEGDSRIIGDEWSKPIDLLWIDGGHSYEFVYSDLCKFGKFATVIALHDLDNPAWSSVRIAIEDFLGNTGKDFHLAEVVGMVATLRRK